MLIVLDLRLERKGFGLSPAQIQKASIQASFVGFLTVEVEGLKRE